MVSVTEYKCTNCGLKFYDDGRCFYYDEELNQTVDFIITFITANWGSESKIKGKVSETYCSECKKYLKVYVIEECNISDSCNIVREGIKNYIKKYQRKIDELKQIRQNPNYSIEKNEFGSSYVVILGYDEFYLYLSDSDLNNEKTAEYILAKFYRDIGESIKHYEEIYYKYVNSIYLIIDKSDAESYSLEKVCCPDCGNEINTKFDELKCPNCESLLMPNWYELD